MKRTLIMLVLILGLNSCQSSCGEKKEPEKKCCSQTTNPNDNPLGEGSTNEQHPTPTP